MKLPVFGIKPRGFTLIELLIVIAIISILISIGLASSRRAQMQSRDRQRQSDVSNIAGALEQFYGDNNIYPPDLDTLTTTPAATTPYIRTIPTDPTSGAAYNGGNYLHTAQSYCLVVGLETVDTPSETCPGQPGTYDFVLSSQD
jgi:prepilin-type N-terminal cleavage/methylation domain-containing protein